MSDTHPYMTTIVENACSLLQDGTNSRGRLEAVNFLGQVLAVATNVVPISTLRNMVVPLLVKVLCVNL
jgi:hypothetical protein